MNDLKKWREAHHSIDITDEALATVAPFPSIYAQDFLSYIESKEVAPEVVAFVRDVNRELAWVYDNWAKAQRDGDPTRLLADMVNAATGDDYAFTLRFLTDYARANNLRLPAATSGKEPAWMTAAGTVTPPAAQFAPPQ